MDKMIQQGHELFKDCGFSYYVCGGFALELFAGWAWRTHFDLDISAFQEDKRKVAAHLMRAGWRVYKRVYNASTPDIYTAILLDSPEDEELDTIRTLWALKDSYTPEPKLVTGETRTYEFTFTPGSSQSEFNFIEIVLDHKSADHFVLNKDKGIVRELSKAILYADGMPYMAPELVLFLKSHQVYSTNVFHKEKTPQDFSEVLPLLPQESRQWLTEALATAYPDGYEWLEKLLTASN